MLIPHILIIDDDARIRDLLKKYLLRNDFNVTTADDSHHARNLLGGLAFDLIICDVMMPGQDGISLTKDLRRKIDTPILLLTAKGEIEDRIGGLEAGADDYLSKPFEPKELLLRLHAILRRVPTDLDQGAGPKIITLGQIRYDMQRKELWKADEQIRLTATESALMGILAQSAGRPIRREDLMSELGRDQSQGQERANDVQITRLRRKIELDSKQPRYLQTVRGEGYMLNPD